MATIDKLLTTLGPRYGFGQNVLLRALLGAWAAKLDDAVADGDKAMAQLSINTAAGVWLQQWGELYNVPRLPNEDDDAYAQRIVRSTIQQRPQLLAIRQLVLQAFALKDFFIADLWPFVLLSDQFALPDEVFTRSTNLLRRSQDFDNPTWSKFGSTILPNAVGAPDGTTAADRLTESALNENHQVFQLLLQPAGATMTFSVYAKPDSRDQITVQMAGTAFTRATFNLTNATFVLTQPTTGTATAGMTQEANGFYRCSITWVGIVVNPLCQILLANGAGVNLYQGNGTSGLYLWGAMVNQGTFPLPYVQTFDTVTSQLVQTVADGMPLQQSDGQLQSTFFNFGPNEAAVSFTPTFAPGAFGYWISELTSQLTVYTLDQVIALLPLVLLSDQFTSNTQVSDGQLTTPGFGTPQDTARHSFALPPVTFPVSVDDVLDVINANRAAGTMPVLMGTQLLPV